MNLSIFNNRTTTAALKRNGLACLALNAGGTYRLERRQEWRGTSVLRSMTQKAMSVSAKPAGIRSVSAISSIPAPQAVISAPVACSNLGGSPSIGTPAPQGLAFGAFRMHAAPVTLDTSANQQEGDA